MNYYDHLVQHQHSINQQEARNRRITALKGTPDHRRGKRKRRQQPS